MNIHRIKTRLGNSYVIEYGDRLLVVDVALGCHLYVLGFIEQDLRRDIADVQLVLCTHDDPDHIGGVAALAAISNAEVAIPYASGATIRKWANDSSGGLVRFATGLREAFRRRAWRMYVSPSRNRAARLQPKFTHFDSDTHSSAGLNPGYKLKNHQFIPGFDDWQVIHTPGHSWDSCCYYHRSSGSLISGDTLLGSNRKDALVTPAIYSNQRHTLQSIERLKSLDISTVYPGHGAVISGSRIIDQVKVG